MTKVTYYMYSYDTCFKIREMMEMDGLDCVKCQNSEKMGHYGNFGIVNEIRQKREQCCLLHFEHKMGRIMQ